MDCAALTRASRAEFVTRGHIHPSASLGPDVQIAEDAFVGPNCYIEGRIVIGPSARLIAGVTLIGEAEIGSGCVIEPNVSMTTVLAPDGRKASPLVIGAGARIGAGSVLSYGLSIGPNAQIGAGTVVVRNVPPHAIVSGNPATIVGYATSPALGRTGLLKATDETSGTTVVDCSVPGVRIFKFPRIRDLRGDLSVGEFGHNVPFFPKRYFLVFDVPSAETRGEHAHRVCEQFLVCVSGRVAVVVDDGARREEVELDAPDVGLYIPPRIWALQYKYSSSSALLVFASHYYDPEDYIRDYQQFLRECAVK
jgi:UDP-2-acetamido-3-amino-2,3-dideoxy-glucuronate N-acetyltransferase